MRYGRTNLRRSAKAPSGDHAEVVSKIEVMAATASQPHAYMLYAVTGSQRIGKAGFDRCPWHPNPWGLLCVFMTIVSMIAPVFAQEIAATPYDAAIEAARERVVKLYGGGFGRERGYGSGVLVSPDGLVVTTLSVLLESPALRVVLPDGGRYPCQIVKRDQRRQLALLKIEATDLAYFDISDSTRLAVGAYVLAAANPFKVADGPEPVSISVGILAGRAPLDARRRAQEYEYVGEVLMTDMIVATPGSAGGALLDLDGRLVGLIGKPVISRRTNTWMNYALPCEEIAAFLREPEANAFETQENTHGVEGAERANSGLLLFDVGGRGRPAYVERVRPGSPAFEAGIRPNDLILTVAGEPIATCDDFYRAWAGLRGDLRVEITLKRGDEIISAELPAEGRQ